MQFTDIFFAFIHKRMEERGLKQRDLVNILEISKSTLSKILSKQRKLSVGIAKKLHATYNLSYDILLADYELASQ